MTNFQALFPEIKAFNNIRAQKIIDSFSKLNVQQQNIIHLIVLLRNPQSANQLRTFYHEIGFVGESPFYSSKEQGLKSLEAAELITNKGGYVYCEDEVMHILTEYLVQKKLDEHKKLASQLAGLLVRSWSLNANSDRLRRISYLRFEGDTKTFLERVNAYLSWNGDIKLVLDIFFNRKVDSSQYFDGNFDLSVLFQLYDLHLTTQIFRLAPPDHHLFNIMAHLDKFALEEQAKLINLVSHLLFLRGQFQDALDLAKEYKSFPPSSLAHPTFNFLSGKFEEAIKGFDAWTDAFRTASKKKKFELDGFEGTLFTLALMAQRNNDLMPRIEGLVKKQTANSNPWKVSRPLLRSLESFFKGHKEEALLLLNQTTGSNEQLISNLFYAIGYYLVARSSNLALRTTLENRSKIHETYRIIHAEVDMLQALCETDQRKAAELLAMAEEKARELNYQPLCLLFRPVEAWETAIETLLRVAGTGDTQINQSEGAKRLIWLVDFSRGNLQAKEQVMGKTGWSKGKNMSEKRVIDADAPFMTDQDKRIILAYYKNQYSSYYYHEREISGKVLEAMVGHPYLYLEKNPEIAIQLTKEEPVLIATKVENGHQLRFSPPIESENPFIVKETPTRYKFVVPTREQFAISKALQGKELFVPEKAEGRLADAIKKIANLVTVQSSLINDDSDVQFVTPDTRICVHLLPVGDGFHIEFYVKPFGDTPPYAPPGKGEDTLVALVDGQRKGVKRDLEAEKKAVKSILTQLSALNKKPGQRHDAWELEDASECLNLLVELAPLVESQQITIEWPKGEKMRINSIVGFDKFKMSVREGSGAWFEVDGGLEIDDNRVMNMRELLALSQKTKSNFIEVSQGQFVALTAEFRRRLDQVNALMSEQRDGSLLLHSLAASAMDPFLDMIEMADFDQKFLENRENIRKAFSGKYKLPKDFNADLRPYQLEGFQWLHKLAAWGVGACLADDMGLGKTVQALAFLTDRKKLGPALVVAPASVCRNWVTEIERFAPALTSVLFGEGEREQAIKNAGKGDLVIVTYDLMTRESDLFTEKKWATIILDEAQAIKNPGTKRSDTAMRLQGDFKIAMSGTPLENHLGELWNLMRFLNPGLLGSQEYFTNKFATPIERSNDNDRRDQLKRLVQPFILRRRKDEVLKDLPAKTEITLHVTLSPDERAFYEALRQNAIEAIASDNESDPGAKHLKILAQLMKLRRAACHPQLADANVKFTGSSKLDVFGETVSELLENGHKALVFSQFVAHLAILEKYLKEKGISYQYLDGQTPLKKRQERIEAFQRGEGDLFLISLKAGGVGLNLTAADFVIHMDPWWNPAVEDQATDRAHRIGQEKPVTVYRIVSEKTIEEKILKLHEQKRDLADSLLEGTSAAAKMNADELLALLKDH